MRRVQSAWAVLTRHQLGQQFGIEHRHGVVGGVGDVRGCNTRELCSPAGDALRVVSPAAIRNDDQCGNGKACKLPRRWTLGPHDGCAVEVSCPSDERLQPDALRCPCAHFPIDEAAHADGGRPDQHRESTKEVARTESREAQRWVQQDERSDALRMGQRELEGQVGTSRMGNDVDRWSHELIEEFAEPLNHVGGSAECTVDRAQAGATRRFRRQQPVAAGKQPGHIRPGGRRGTITREHQEGWATRGPGAEHVRVSPDCGDVTGFRAFRPERCGRGI
jgi:hypothetical protein